MLFSLPSTLRKTNPVKLCGYALREPSKSRNQTRRVRQLAELAREGSLAHPRPAGELPADVGGLRAVLPQARGQPNSWQWGWCPSAVDGGPGAGVCRAAAPGAGAQLAVPLPPVSPGRGANGGSNPGPGRPGPDALGAAIGGE